MDRKALLNATSIGTLAQLAMIGLGHFVPFIKDHVFAIGGMAISFAVAWLYARQARGGWSTSLSGGAVSGGVCGLIGIIASVALGDTQPVILVLGTLASVVAGLVGGALGRLAWSQPVPPR